MTFFSAFTDNSLILDRVFQGGEVEIFEFRSEAGRPLRKFESMEELQAGFKIESWDEPRSTTILLNIYHKEASGELRHRAIETVNGTFDSIEGWGLIQLYLMPWRNGKPLQPCTLQCNTIERARNNSEGGSERLGDYRAWNWDVVRKYKGRLESFLRRQKARALFGQPILPAADRLMSQIRSEHGEGGKASPATS